VSRYAVARRAPRPGWVQTLCSLLEVSRSGYYRWLAAKPSARSRADVRLKQQILTIHGETRGRYGTPRVHQQLAQQGESTSRKRVARLRRELGLRARQPKSFHVTTQSEKGLSLPPNRLARQFTAAAPNQIWVGDITYLWTPDGWLYLAILIDLFARRVVGWALSDRCDSALAETALAQALEERRPPPGLLHHSDQGSTYTSRAYGERLAAASAELSYSRRGNCWDNAVAESFFSTLKTELGARFDSPEHARAELFLYLEAFYNPCRLHSAAGGLSPADREAAYHQQKNSEAGRDSLRGSRPDPNPPEEQSASGLKGS
jgi:putative transposase